MEATGGEPQDEEQARRARVLRNTRALVKSYRIVPREAARRYLALHGLTPEDLDAET